MNYCTRSLFNAMRRGDFVKKDKSFQTFLFYIEILPFLYFNFVRDLNNIDEGK